MRIIQNFIFQLLERIRYQKEYLVIVLKVFSLIFFTLETFYAAGTLQKFVLINYNQISRNSFQDSMRISYINNHLRFV